jgi:Photosynthesis system II assembly factor YCF48
MIFLKKISGLGILMLSFFWMACDPSATKNCPKLTGIAEIGNWRVEKTGVENPQINQIEFLDSLVGFGTFNFSSIVRTLDGGNTWLILDVGSRFFGGQFDFCARDTGFIAQTFFNQTSNWRQIFFQKTVDGGQTFQTVGDTFPADIVDLRFFDAQNGCFLGNFTDTLTYGGVYGLYKTNDGGKNWSRDSFFEPDTFYQSMQWVSNKIGFVINQKNEIFRTTDGGKNWKLMNSVQSQNFFGANYVFLNEKIGFAFSQNFGGFGSFAPATQTIDGGKNWNTVPENLVLSAVLAFENTQNILAIGNSKQCNVDNAEAFFATNDLGQNWDESLPIQDVNFWQHVPCRNPQIFFARAGERQLLKISKK